MPNVAVVYTDTAAHPMVLTEAHVAALRAALTEGEIRHYRSEAEALSDRFDAEVLFCWGRDTPDALCAHYPRLRWVQSLSAGVEGLEMLSAVRSGELILSKMKAVHGPVMAQTALGYILSFLRCFPALQAQQRAHVWDKPALEKLRECCDITVGICGLGDIGTEVSRLCKLLGMTVYGCRRTAAEIPWADRMYPFGSRGEMLAQCDFVVNLLPDTAETRKSIDAAFFAAMRPGAIFINIGRGASVDTDALIAALRSGAVAGAALDVTDPEPLPADSPLWDMDNVLITPHCSADSENYFDRAVITLTDNLIAYQESCAVPTQVLRMKKAVGQFDRLR